MKTRMVPSSWLHRDGRRFDSGPYTSGALEAKIRLEELDVPKDKLASLTHGYEGGIYHAGREGRAWVDSPEYGVPFVGSSAILAADLTNLPLLSKKQVVANPKFVLRPGWILITRSGTIGRMVYSRPDMDGMACSEDVMRVVPNPDRVPPGYIYAFLSSKLGVPIVTSGTYGAIIQHIEPQHIADLPVPRLGGKIEQQAHELVEKAAALRVEANHLLRSAIAATLDVWSVEDLSATTPLHPDVQIVSAFKLARFSRFDAAFYSAEAASSDAALSKIGQRMTIHQLGEVVAQVFETQRFGRVTVKDRAYGVPFLSISDLVRFDPRTDALVSKKQAEQVNAIAKKGWLVLPRVGQLQGVFGTVCFMPEHLDGVGVSDNNIRIVPTDEDTGAYLWAALSTRICYLQITRRACGTSIPYLDAKRVAEIPIPWPIESQRLAIAANVKRAMLNRSLAVVAEDQARTLVERAIEEAG